MYSTILKGELDNRRYGMIVSFVLHALLLLAVLFAPVLSVPPTPPEPGGILVNLGVPDQEGTGDENAQEGKPGPIEEAQPEQPSEPEPQPEEEVKPTPKPEKPSKPTTSKPQPQKEVVTTEDPEAVALRKQKEQKRKQEEAESKARAEQAARDKAAADAAAKAKAEQAAKDKALKDQIGGALGGGKGNGKGNSGKTGNPGDPNGGDSDILSGKSTGSGVIGGGLGNRGVASRPSSFTNTCPQTGRVVIYVCADSNGNVTKAELTLKGSDVSATCNTNLAIAHAKKYRFNKGEGTVCGTITYKFDEK
ncbi:MAG: hypothetical protein IT258_14370 [Saprospiraceae bacterium]|nr:hypothetical protein [Saprospiraceae bacterium]